MRPQTSLLRTGSRIQRGMCRWYLLLTDQNSVTVQTLVSPVPFLFDSTSMLSCLFDKTRGSCAPGS